MPRSYPPEFGRKVLDRVAAGKPIAEVAESLGVSGQTIYYWRALRCRVVQGHCSDARSDW